MEEQLQICEAVFAAMSTGLIITDPNQPSHPIVDCNPAFERMTGYARAEILGRNCRFLQRDDRKQKPLEEVRTALNEHRPCRVVLRNYRKDGTLFWNELALSPVFDDQDHLIRFVGLQHDITDLVPASKEHWQQLATRIETLAPRQREVMELLVDGVQQRVAPFGKPKSPTVFPKWDPHRSELRFCGRLVKVFKLPCSNQATVLMAFEHEGWPSRIDDPLPYAPKQEPKRRLQDTIRGLNCNQKECRIRFQDDGAGEGILWEPV